MRKLHGWEPDVVMDWCDHGLVHALTPEFLKELGMLSLGLRYLGQPEQADRVAAAFQSARRGYLGRP
jgi:hypothetical protein